MYLFRSYQPKTHVRRGEANTFCRRIVSYFRKKKSFSIKSKTKNLFTGKFPTNSNIDRLRLLSKSQNQTQSHGAWKTCLARKKLKKLRANI